LIGGVDILAKVIEILVRVESLGVSARAVGGKIRVRTPKPLPDDLIR
jgi:hypothetical protein